MKTLLPPELDVRIKHVTNAPSPPQTVTAINAPSLNPLYSYSLLAMVIATSEMIDDPAAMEMRNKPLRTME
jgi:hypothetical protein